jgi:dipeptidase E
MKHIIAIGGGEIGRPGYPIETTDIDKQIISLANKSNPMVLFLPTASSDNVGYSEVFNQHYGARLGCAVEVLNLYSKPSAKTIASAIGNADIIYVGGGNTLKMMTLWRRYGVDKLLSSAYRRGTILCGLSAGAICWFNAGLSDSRSFTSKGQSWNYINVRGLRLKNILYCPHYDTEPARQPALKNKLKNTKKIAIAVDNCAALEIKDDKFRIISSRDGAKAYRAYWKNGDYFVEAIEASTKYAQLSDLLS